MACFTFAGPLARAKRAFLRADPDIIMVGESRDKETVSMGVEASLTGHMVFSTLHTNSAPESIVRLLDMGMDPFNFADALVGILAQRLARKLCTCSEAYRTAPDELRRFVTEYAQELSTTPAWKEDPGGQAQLLLDSWHELLVADDTIKRLIQERARVSEIFSAGLQTGMRTLKMDGMEKIMLGLTDIKQVRAVCIK